MSHESTPHAMLIFAGLDPSGGAGLIADVQAAAAMGQHTLAVATTLTAQSLRGFESQHPVDTGLIEHQTRAAVRDFDVRAVKLGAIPTLSTLQVIADLVEQLNPQYFVVDPVRRTTSGGQLFEDISIHDYKRALLPLDPIVTPNRQELDDLCTALTMQAQARELIEQGARAVLVTDGDGSGTTCKHTLFARDFDTCVFEHERLPGSYRGTGCILTTSLTAALMLNDNLREAAQQALDYTFGAIKQSKIQTKEGTVSVPQRVTPK